MSGSLLTFLDFVECCFKKRARAGRGRRTGCLCCFTFSFDGVSGLRWGSTESTEEFWDSAATLLTSEQSVLTLFLQFNEFKGSLSSFPFLFVTDSPFFAGDFSPCVLTDKLSLLGTSCTLFVRVVVLVCSVL